MRALSCLAAVTASALLLGGCTAANPVPAGYTTEEAAAIVDEQHAEWWHQMFPGKPRPVIETVAVVSPGDSYGQTLECVLDANVPGLRVVDGGFSFASDDPAVVDAFHLALYTCALRYPVDISEPGALGFYTDAQLEYLDDYYRERLAPCLRMLGYTVPNTATRDDVQSSVGYVPYMVMTPQPSTEAEWALIDLRCPPPPLGPSYRSAF